MTLRPISLTSAEENRMIDGTGTPVFRVEVKRRTDAAWTDATNVAGGDWVLAISVDGDTPDKPVSSFTIRFLRAADGSSMAPGIAGSGLNTAAGLFSPLLYTGRLVRVDAGNLAPGQVRADATWHRWLEGEIDKVEWPGDDVVAQCTSLDAVLQRTQIEEEEIRGEEEPGVPLATEIQGLLDRWRSHSPVTLLVEGDPDHGVGEYKTPLGSLGDFLLTQAQRIAWDLRYRWDEASAAFRYMLYNPPRGKITPDLTMAASRVIEVPELSVDRTNIRNAFTLTRPDAETGKVVKQYTTEPSSIAEFDRVWMGIQEPSDSSINNAARGDALLSYARSDLARPPVEKRVRLPFLPYLALHHVLRIGADGKRFDFAQNYAVVQASHEVSADGGAFTIASLRGGNPVGMYYAWDRRNKGGTGTLPLESEEEGLINFREYTDSAGITTLAWDGTGTLVQEVWAGSVVFDVPLPVDPWALVAGVVLPLPPGTLSLTYAQPGEGQRRLIQVETRLAFMEQGPAYRVNQFGTPAPIVWEAVPTETEDDVTLAVRVSDPRGVVSLVRFYTLILGVRSGPFDATASETNWYAYTLALDPKHPVGIQPEIVRNDGFPPILGEMYTADTGKKSNIWDVRRGVGDEVLVDSDTDTVSLHYKEVVGGTPGAETSIPARGSDPRFGVFSPAPGATERLYRIYGKNAAGEAGEYVEWKVPAEEVVDVEPALLAASIGIVNRDSGGGGREEVFSVTFEVSAVVDDTNYELYATIYEVVSGSPTFKTFIADIVPSDEVGTKVVLTGSSLSKTYSATLTLHESSGGVAGSAIGTIVTPPRASSVI